MLAEPGQGFDMQAPTAATADEERLLRKRQVALGYRLFASSGWGDDGAGHITARDPELTDHMWLLRYGITFGDATVDDLVLVDGAGAIVDGPAQFGFNTTAFNIHHPIHARRPDIVSVCHTHTPYGTPLAALCEPLRMSSQESCAFHRAQAVYLGEKVDVVDPAGGHAIAEALDANRLALLGNHGMLTVGTTVGAALGFFWLAERAAEVQIKAPAARVISDAAAAAAYGSIGTEANGWLVFEYLVRSRLGDPSVAG